MDFDAWPEHDPFLTEAAYSDMDDEEGSHLTGEEDEDEDEDDEDDEDGSMQDFIDDDIVEHNRRDHSSERDGTDDDSVAEDKNDSRRASRNPTLPTDQVHNVGSDSDSSAPRVRAHYRRVIDIDEDDEEDDEHGVEVAPPIRYDRGSQTRRAARRIADSSEDEGTENFVTARFSSVEDSDEEDSDGEEDDDDEEENGDVEEGDEDEGSPSSYVDPDEY